MYHKENASDDQGHVCEFHPAERRCLRVGEPNVFSEVDLEKNVQWWSGWAQETIDDYRSRKGARHNVKYERQQRSLVYSMQSLHPNSRMADHSTFVECGTAGAK
jgi:hypothetical protein